MHGGRPHQEGRSASSDDRTTGCRHFGCLRRCDGKRTPHRSETMIPNFEWVFRGARGVAIVALLFCFSLDLWAADSPVRVQLDMKKAAPRAVETLTERTILRDYRLAWTSMAQALEFTTP